MTTELDLVSVVIPTYFRNSVLEDALDSVQNQRYESIEIIVVDDSGEQHAEPVISGRSGVSVVYHEENKGAQAARETGIRVASGEFIQLLDDDDLLKPAKIARQVDLLAQADAGVAYCGVTQPEGSGHVPQHYGDVLNEALAFRLFPAITSSLLIDADVLRGVLPLERLTGSQDLWLMIELAKRTEFDAVDKILVDRRAVDERIGSSMGAVKGRWAILEEFSGLYARAPDWVESSARANSHHLAGEVLLSSSAWSLRALYYFAKAFQHSPSRDTRHLKAFCLSLFGRKGLQFGKRMSG